MKQQAKRGRIERLLFSFMGPPQLGGGSSRTVPADVPGPPCSRCGQAYDVHEVVRDPRLTYVRCPAGDGPNGRSR